MPNLLYTWYFEKFTASVTSSGHSALRHVITCRMCTILYLAKKCDPWNAGNYVHIGGCRTINFDTLFPVFFRKLESQITMFNFASFWFWFWFINQQDSLINEPEPEPEHSWFASWDTVLNALEKSKITINSSAQHRKSTIVSCFFQEVRKPDHNV